MYQQYTWSHAIQVCFTSAGWCKFWPVWSLQVIWSPPIPTPQSPSAPPLLLQPPPTLPTTLVEEPSEDILPSLLGHAPSDCLLWIVDQLQSPNSSIGFLWKKYYLYQMHYKNIVHLVRGTKTTVKCGWILQNWKKNRKHMWKKSQEWFNLDKITPSRCIMSARDKEDALAKGPSDPVTFTKRPKGIPRCAFVTH